MMGRSVTFFYHTWDLLIGFLGLRVDIFFSLEYFHSLPYILTYFLLSLSQSHLTLCDFLDCSPLGSSVHGILQARILE